MDDYLTKPVDRDTMLRVIARLTDPSTMPSYAINENHDHTDHPDAEDVDELVNESVLHQLARDTGAEVLPKLLDLYTKDARARISRIEEAVTAKDYQILEFESHTLGSSAGAHGNLRLQQIARQIEHLCQKNEHELATERAIALIEISEASLQLIAERATAGFGYLR